MPRKPKTKPVELPAIPAELLEQFGDGPMTAEAINRATLALKKALIERALGGEMRHHLGYPPGAAKPAAFSNQRNGTGAKTVVTEDGPIRNEVPRDRDGSFKPLLIPKHERRFTGFDDKIVALYARGMTVREIQGILQEQYGTEVSPDFISSVTDEVMLDRLLHHAHIVQIAGESYRLKDKPRGQARKQPRDTESGWVRFTSAYCPKVGQDSVGVDR
ncbi:hypothetical protein LMG19083_04673 [Ralstonia psammae]|uniref:Mutator family transposase n=1 Tax=Ralstonia psammae TaxID=3058598 RepID=A0ABM9JZ95_9RALS|nr:transposase [Ralstonia sp. LMG 19083]CAJ0808219.1 hypothetical protein LMG19083_04673 [Ralstonia sp. LMG 19083]